jgi:hypothetical protein
MSPILFYRLDNDGAAEFRGVGFGVIAGVLLVTPHDPVESAEAPPPRWIRRLTLY